MSGARPSLLEVQEEEAEQEGDKLEEGTVLIGEGEKVMTEEDSEVPESSFAEELFIRRKTDRVKLTMRERRKERHHHGLERAKDSCQPRKEVDWSLGISGVELRHLEEVDPTLTKVRAAAQGEVNSAGQNFVEWNGLVYRRWVPRTQDEEMAVEQVVLPKECRRTVLHLAHTISIAGHLGRKKTAKQILKRFYWPTLYRDVADFCRSCEVCQKATHQRVSRALMVPLPVVEEPFQRVAINGYRRTPTAQSFRKPICPCGV